MEHADSVYCCQGCATGEVSRDSSHNRKVTFSLGQVCGMLLMNGDVVGVVVFTDGIDPGVWGDPFGVEREGHVPEEAE